MKCMFSFFSLEDLDILLMIFRPVLKPNLDLNLMSGGELCGNNVNWSFSFAVIKKIMDSHYSEMIYNWSSVNLNCKCVYITFVLFQNPSLKPKAKDGEERKEGNSQESEVRKIHSMIICGAIVRLPSFRFMCGCDSVSSIIIPLVNITIIISDSSETSVLWRVRLFVPRNLVKSHNKGTLGVRMLRVFAGKGEYDSRRCCQSLQRQSRVFEIRLFLLPVWLSASVEL